MAEAASLFLQKMQNLTLDDCKEDSQWYMEGKDGAFALKTCNMQWQAARTFSRIWKRMTLEVYMED